MFGVKSVPFDEAVPDLRSSGATPCVAVASTTSGTLWTKRCGADLVTQALTITLQASPTLVRPPAGATVTPGDTFLWSAFDGGVHGLALEPDFAQATIPAMYIYTAGTTAAWPDLTGQGVPFPAEATYHCTIVGLGPYATMDDAFGKRGWAPSRPPNCDGARRSPSTSRSHPKRRTLLVCLVARTDGPTEIEVDAATVGRRLVENARLELTHGHLAR
jgi:hypothetical protein